VVRFAGDEEEEEDEEVLEVVEGVKKEGDGDGRKVTRVRLSAKERERRRAEAAAVDACDVLVTRWRYGRAYVQVRGVSCLVFSFRWNWNLI
jgi:hypothetical protein